MRKLQEPLKNVSIEQIFLACIENIRDNKRKKDYLELLDDVCKTTESYKKYVPEDVVHYKQRKLEKTQQDELSLLYKAKFAGKSGPGRGYYDAIMINADGRCPVCGVGTPAQLDHYLPKSAYPLLSISPANLIPTCRDCNENKRNYIPNSFENTLIHPYLESIEDKWLAVSLDFKDQGTVIPFYKNIIQTGILKERLNKYIEIYKLNEIYSTRAIDEIYSIKFSHEEKVKNKNEEMVRFLVEDARKSAEQSDMNSWKSALYRALEAQIDEYIEWLK